MKITNHEGEFRLLPSSSPRFYEKILFFYQFTGIKISRVKFCSNYITISPRGCSLNGVEFFETLVKFPTKAGRQKS